MSKLLTRIFHQASIAYAIGLVGLTASVGIAQELDPSIKAPFRDPDNSAVHLLDPDDWMTDGWNERRSHLTDPDRNAGLYDPQRYTFGWMYQAFPTYFGAPIAMTTEDLIAGDVDVAVVGITVEQQPVPGSRYAANAMRSLVDWLQYGGHDTDQWLGVSYMEELTLADFGNVGAHYMLASRSTEEIHAVVSEILAADTVPLGVGGTHIQAWGFITALVEKYGPESFAMLHIDAHYDTYGPVFGAFIHNGSFIKQAVDNGILKGSDVIQVGLRGVGPDRDSLAWMRENKLRFHMMPEIERDGWDAVLDKVLAELKGKKVYISWDMDGIDPVEAPAVGTHSLGGITFLQGAELLRKVSIQNEIIAIEFNEYNPLMDDAHQTTGVLMDRLMRSFLAGHAARKIGITDPHYVSAERIDHGVPADE